MVRSAAAVMHHRPVRGMPCPWGGHGALWSARTLCGARRSLAGLGFGRYTKPAGRRVCRPGSCCGTRGAGPSSIGRRCRGAGPIAARTLTGWCWCVRGSARPGGAGWRLCDLRRGRAVVRDHRTLPVMALRSLAERRTARRRVALRQMIWVCSRATVAGQDDPDLVRKAARGGPLAGWPRHRRRRPRGPVVGAQRLGWRWPDDGACACPAARAGTAPSYPCPSVAAGTT